MPAKKKSAKKPPKVTKLTAEIHKRFAIAYVALGENACQAYLAIRPRVKLTSAAVEGGKLLRNPYVAEIIAKERERLRRKYELTGERVLREHAKLAFFDPKKLVDADGKPLPLHLVDDDTAAALGSIKLQSVAIAGDVVTHHTNTFKPYSKPAVLNMLNRILHLEDIPPKEPDDTPVDHLDLARRMAFRLAKTAKTLEAAKPVKSIAKPAKIK